MAALPTTTPKRAAAITFTASVVALLLAAAPVHAADKLEPILAHLRLGYSLKQVQTILRPASGHTWISSIEPRGHIERYRLERNDLRKPDPRIETWSLGFKKGRLVDIQLIYDAANTRAGSVDQRASEWQTIYGDPQRGDDGYYWSDGSTVLRVFSSEKKVLDGDTPSVELRTSEELYEQGVFDATD